jgi:hypothetical protein
MAPADIAKEEALHATHPVAPVVVTYWPAEQLEQVVVDSVEEYWPAGQLVHPVDPVEEYWPAGQLEQVVDPVEEYWPAGQSAHTAVWAAVGAEQVEAEQARAPQQAYWPVPQLVQGPLKSAG